MRIYLLSCALVLQFGAPCIAGAAARPPMPPIATPVELAADAGHPYSNVDHSNDAGNDTGDSQIESLNEQQLNGNYKGPWYYGRPPPPGVRPPPNPPAYAQQPPSYGAPAYGYPPQAYYPPPPRYRVPPPGYYPPPPGYYPPPPAY